MERPFFPTKNEAPRELARVGLVSKHHYHAQIIQFDVLNSTRWQANIEAKQAHFSSIATDHLLHNTELWYLIHGTTNGSLTP